MTASKKFAGLCLAAAISAVVAAPAWAGPSGDEYLPNVPSATGHQSSSGGSQGGSSGSISPQTSTAADTTPSAPQKSKDNGQQKTRSETTAAIPVPASSNDGGGSSGGGSSMVPIILLIVAGVIVTVVGMTLTRRRGTQAEPPDGDGNRLERPSARPTPDGEIVAGGDKPA